MTVVPDNMGRIKVILSSSDVENLGISIKEIDCSDPDTRLLLRAVFKMASYRIGKNLDSGRLLIEAYPSLDGGGVLYFTPLEKSTAKKRLRLKQVKAGTDNCYNYIFKEGEALLQAIKLLYANEDTLKLTSCLYSIEDKFVLTVEGNPQLTPLIRAKEFSDLFLMGRHINKYTREHGKALTGENAIMEIGSKLG